MVLLIVFEFGSSLFTYKDQVEYDRTLGGDTWNKYQSTSEWYVRYRVSIALAIKIPSLASTHHRAFLALSP